MPHPRKAGILAQARLFWVSALRPGLGVDLMTVLAGILMAAALTAGTTGQTAESPHIVPTAFEAGHFYAVPETSDGQKLKLLVDTGGGGMSGMYWITEAAAQRLDVKTTSCTIRSSEVTVAPLPNYKPGRSLPPPLAGPCGEAMMVFGKYDADGQIGAAYLLGRVWTFDYPAQQLSLEPGAWRPDPGAHATPLGFKRAAHGKPQGAFPRIIIRVDGKPLGMLLDTGATAHPTASGKAASGMPTVNGEGVASYITTSMLDRWHKAHPEWRVVDNGDDLFAPQFMARLIEVPEMEIAGWLIGPVWFTERPDPAFHNLMNRLMDKTPEGAIGGNIFSHFVMTIDYPQATAYFSCAEGCKATVPKPTP